MTEADKKIQQLLEKVKNKKQEIKEAERPSWKTNCNFAYHGVRINIQTSSEEDIITAYAFLLGHQENAKKAASKLEVSASSNYNGYAINKWEEDFKARVSQIRIAEKRQELSTLETRLNAIISPELRAAMELSAIEDALK